MIYRFSMKRYKNETGQSRIYSYKIGADYIEILFRGEQKPRKYTHAKAGAEVVAQLKSLAVLGSGLDRYLQRKAKTIVAE